MLVWIPTSRLRGGGRLLEVYVREAQYTDCLKVLLKSPILVINDTGDRGCSVLPLAVIEPRNMGLLLDAGAKPYWHDATGRRIELIRFLLENGLPGPLKVALEHPACGDQLAGDRARQLLLEALRLEPASPGWCATGYESYVQSVNTASDLVIQKCLDLGVAPDQEMFKVAAAASDWRRFGLLVTAAPGVAKAHQRELVEAVVDSGNGAFLKEVASMAPFRHLPLDWPYRAWVERQLNLQAKYAKENVYFDLSLTQELVELGDIPESERSRLYWEFVPKLDPQRLCAGLKLDPEHIWSAAPDGVKFFFKAIDNNDGSRVKALAGQDSLSWTDGEGRTPLERAAWRSAPAALEALLSASGTRPFDAWVLNRALNQAASSGSAPCLRILLSRLPDKVSVPGSPNVIPFESLWVGAYRFNGSPIETAAAKGHLDLLRIIRETRGRDRIPDQAWNLALLAAERSGQDQVFHALVEEFGAIPGRLKIAADRDWFSRWDPLPVAARQGDLELMRYIMAWGEGHPEYVLGDRAALFCAVENGRLEALDLILDKRNPGPEAIATAVFTAVLNDQRECLKRLLKERMDWSLPRSDTGSALAVAMANDRLDYVDLLIKAGVDPKKGPERTEPPFLQAVMGVSFGPMSKDRLIQTDTAPVLKSMSTETLQYMVHAWKIDLNTQDEWGNTAIRRACSSLHEDLALELLALGADPDIMPRPTSYSAPYEPLIKDARSRGLIRLVDALKRRQVSR